MSRPSDYTQELADEICSQLAEGISLRTVCLPDEMPNKSTVFRWLRTHEEFRDQYAKAKESSADALLEDMFHIADNDKEDVQRSRLRVDVRKWAASKLKPKKYGDKTTLLGDDENPLIVERIERVIVNDSLKNQDS